MNFRKVPLEAGLYFVGVPIGTARDITLRALDVFASADVLAAEDTRALRRLLDIHGVPLQGRKIMALHDHSGPAIQNELVSLIAAGQSVAYASEAGMPMISDPGFELGRAVHQEGLMVTAAPGPSALLTALVVAGLPTDSFHFAGFLPSGASARQAALTSLRDIPATLIFFESPKRLAAFLTDAAERLGPDRAAAVCRELTKKFEEVKRGTLKELTATYQKEKVKGEIVVLVERKRSEKITTSELENALKAALEHHSTRDAVDLVANAHDVPRRKVYQLALALGKE